MEPLKKILPDFYRRRSGADDVEQELALACWADAVGPDLARHTAPVRLARNMLVVDVATQALLDPLKSLSDRIMGRLNKAIGKPAVTRIVFRLALPGKIPVRRAATVTGDTGAGDVAVDEAVAIQDPHLRRIYKQSRGNALRKPKDVSPLTVKISEKEVRYIAELANLRLSNDEIAKHAADLEEILTYVEKLNELDTENVEPMAQVIYPGSETATLRDDAVGASFSQDLALQPAPKAGAGHFKVPKVIER